MRRTGSIELVFIFHIRPCAAAQRHMGWLADKLRGGAPAHETKGQLLTGFTLTFRDWSD
ncbi:hypothetical protein AAU01_11140 [Paenarthrobacter aurescens]|uniref:Uncharacterized protein n=1 Tax=Paenarthrobacter aurescens TaxID=43663 RepID=A0A4Y3NI08_PAEAU|nr:hypothetical protein AAU01_11140 [Paenarthrobacter aurescens]